MVGKKKVNKVLSLKKVLQKVVCFSTSRWKKIPFEVERHTVNLWIIIWHNKKGKKRHLSGAEPLDLKGSTNVGFHSQISSPDSKPFI